MVSRLDSSSSTPMLNPQTSRCPVWVGGKTIVNQMRTKEDFKPFSDEAVAWAKDLKKRGFKFLGPTVVYAHMQATGMVNDHTMDCFRYQQLVG